MKSIEKHSPILVAAIGVIAGLIGSPFLKAVTDRVFDNQDKNIEKQRDIVLVLQERLDKYISIREDDVEKRAKEIQQINILQKRIISLETEVKQLKATKVHRDSKELIAIMMNSKPWPSWLQDVENRRWYLNDAYCEAFNVARKDFWTPVNILARYPVKTVSQYVSNDMKVLESNTTIRFRELVPEKIMLPSGPDNPAKYWNVVKYPTPANGTKYMMGDAFQDEKDSILDYIK